MTMNKADLKSLITLLEEMDSKEAKRIVKKIQKELKPISVSSRKSKGRGLQQTVAKEFSERTGIPWGYDNQEIQPRQMGGAGTDIILTGKARELIPFDVECKNTESFSFKSVIEQAVSNTEEGRTWLIVHKRNGMKPVAILDMEDFFNIFFKGGE